MNSDHKTMKKEYHAIVHAIRNEINQNIDAMEKIDGCFYYEIEDGVYKQFKTTDNCMVKISEDLWIRMTKVDCVKYFTKRVELLSAYIDRILAAK